VGALFVYMTDVTARGIVLKHGLDATRVIDMMIEHAIRHGLHDEVQGSDRVRWAVVLIACL
jgi:hypothetical protein